MGSRRLADVKEIASNSASLCVISRCGVGQRCKEGLAVTGKTLEDCAAVWKASVICCGARRLLGGTGGGSGNKGFRGAFCLMC